MHSRFFIIFVLSVHLTTSFAEEEEDGECSMRSSCKARNSINWHNGYFGTNCYCDRLCKYFDDCCSDFFGADVRGKLEPGSFMCVLDSRLYHRHIYIIEKCPKNEGKSQLRELCENYETRDTDDRIFYQWLVVGESGLTYRNYYCAMCNKETNIQFWKADMKCKDKFAYDKSDLADMELATRRRMKASESCSLWFQHPNNSPRTCKQYIDICPQSWTNERYRNKCKSLTSFQYKDSVLGMLVYKNNYCAFCNGERKATCKDNRRSGPNGDARDFKYKAYPFSLLLDINGGSGRYRRGVVGEAEPIIIKTTTLNSCELGRVYDPFARVCRLIIGVNFASEKDLAVPFKQGNHPLDGCTFIILKNDTKFVKYSNGTIYVAEQDILYGREKYQERHGEIILCTNFTQNYTLSSITEQTRDKFGPEQGIVSTVCLVISLVALALQFIVYMMFPTMRNLPGKNITSLVSAMFLSLLLYLLAPFGMLNKPACQFIAVALHYMFLVAHFWMNVMAFDVWKTFASAGLRSESKSKHFVYYSIYAWLTPIFIVSLSILANFIGPSTYWKPKYGVHLCWFGERTGLLIFFGVPLLLLILGNILFFVLTAWALYKVSEDTQMATKRKHKKQLLLYAKLATIMGITWIFGFVATLTNATFLWYTFIVFNTLQGVFIFLAFTCTKKVYKLFRERFCSGRRLLQYRRSDSVSKTFSTRINSLGSEEMLSTKCSTPKITRAPLFL